MSAFNREDICQAYWLLEVDWGCGGRLPERPSNQRRHESTGCQLSRIGFAPPSGLCYSTLSENGREIYDRQRTALGLFEVAKDPPEQKGDANV